MENLAIYNATRKVPEIACKDFDNGSFKGTDINPMWRIKTLTEQFGPCGIGWYYEVLSERSESYGDTVMAIVDLNLYIKVDGEWSKPIYGTGGNALVKPTRNGLKPSDEGYKMALTDALSVACKALGIGADVYFAKDKTKYTAAEAPQKVEAPAAYFAPDNIKAFCEAQKISVKMFTSIYNALCEQGRTQRIPSTNMTEEQCTSLLTLVKSELEKAS